MNNLKEKLDKVQSYDNLLIHARGFAYDSLIYRFKDYQSRAFQTEVNDYKYSHNAGEQEAKERVRARHDKDLMRFIQILNEVIGEHDRKERDNWF